MESFTVKNIHPATTKHALLGHPWITKDTISSKWPSDKLILNVQIKPGLVYTYLHDPKHPFCIARLFAKQVIQTIDQLKINVQQNINRALKKRMDAKILSSRNHFILAFAEADDLPGLTITYLNQRVLIQTQMQIWDKWILELKVWIETACEAYGLPVNSIWWQPRSSQQTIAKCYLHQNFVDHQDTFLVEELGFQMQVTLGSRYDHGVYTDMCGIRESLQKLQLNWQEKSVLNLFSYTGAFSLMALKLGANYCCSIDASSAYQTIFKHNLNLNFQNEEKNKIMTCDINDGLKNLNDKKNSFDVIIFDPPSSFTSKNKKVQTVTIYPDLLKKIECLTSNDSKILCFLNHHQTTRTKFESIIKNALPKWKMVHRLELNHDATILPHFPEGDYLKGAWLERKK